MGDYSKMGEGSLIVDGLEATVQPDGATIYTCPGCKKWVRVDHTYSGKRSIHWIIQHEVPCEWFNDRIKRNSLIGFQELIRRTQKANEIFQNVRPKD